MDFWQVFEITFTVLLIVTSLWKAARSMLHLARSKKLYPHLLQLMAEAEATGKTGPEKLNYVLARVKAYAKAKGFKADLNHISDLIDKIIALTKTVNAK